MSKGNGLPHFDDTGATNWRKNVVGKKQCDPRQLSGHRLARRYFGTWGIWVGVFLPFRSSRFAHHAFSPFHLIPSHSAFSKKATPVHCARFKDQPLALVSHPQQVATRLKLIGNQWSVLVLACSTGQSLNAGSIPQIEYFAVPLVQDFARFLDTFVTWF